MTAKLYARDGGTAGASDIDITDVAPFFDDGTALIEMGMNCQNGAASQGRFVVMDPDASLVQASGLWLPPHTRIRWTEDASGTERWLAQGRISGGERGRGDVVGGDAIEHHWTVDDANVELRGLAFTEDWVRPAETDTDRLYALQAYILNGNSSTSPNKRPSTVITISDSHLAPDSNTFDMPAKTYTAGTQPIEVFEDCMTSSGKTASGVVIHHTGGSHLCLLYILETDHTTYASTVKISDKLANWDPDDLTAPVLEPHWDQGMAVVKNDQAAISGLVSRYGTEDRFVYVNDTAQEDDYEHWDESYNDPDSVTATQATARATAIRSYRGPGDATFRVSVEVAAEQHHLLAAGMSLKIDTAPILGGFFRGTYIDARIVNLAWEPKVDGRYLAHMQLNRGYRSGVPAGSSQPAATSPKPAPAPIPDTVVSPTPVWGWDWTTNNKDTTNAYSGGLVREVSGYGPAVAAFGNNYGKNDASAFTTQDVPISANTEYSFRIDILWRYTPNQRNVDIDWRNISHVTARTDRWVTGAGHALYTEYHEVVTFTSPATASFVRIRFKNWAGIYADNMWIETPGSIIPGDSDPDALPDGGDSPYYARSDDPRFDSADQHSITRLSRTMTNASGGDLESGAVVIATGENTVDTTTTPALTTARVGFLMEDIADGEDGLVAWESEGAILPTFTGSVAAGDFIYTSSTPGAVDVDPDRTEGAIGRVVADNGSGAALFVEWWGVPDAAEPAPGLTSHNDLTDLDDNDHPQYRLTTDGGQDVINVVAASGSAETLDLADGNVHDVTLTADCTLTLAGATAGVECSMAILLRQGAAAPWSVIWPGSIEWVGGDEPVLETTVDAWNWVTLVTLDGGTVWYGSGGTSAAGVSAADLVELGVVGPVLIADDHSTPLVFGDLIQTEAGDDLLYADIGD